MQMLSYKRSDKNFLYFKIKFIGSIFFDGEKSALNMVELIIIESIPRNFFQKFLSQIKFNGMGEHFFLLLSPEKEK